MDEYRMKIMGVCVGDAVRDPEKPERDMLVEEIVLDEFGPMVRARCTVECPGFARSHRHYYHPRKLQVDNDR